ncbi:hypothetical protein JVT61DRAFT_4032 [Boletus reticuloceps]|uniref:VWFA domain-containing protein n=1 Tax=Boletus reticuloceps TaxID=495285 RepID=A0A8I2YM52_9AGAM|nr:hypothetical protein JVT61DRAFT_4032 [Boletus reticuloceps]
MHHFEVADDALLPLSWIPTRGNDIPPHAVPVHGGFYGQLYIARGFLWGEMHIGTTSHSSIEGARLSDKYGQCHAVFEYEVLTCASSLRFQLEQPPQSLIPVPETTATTPRWPVYQEGVSTARSPSLSPKTPQKLTPFPWLSSPHDQPAPLPNETRGIKYQGDPPPYTSPSGGAWIEVPKQTQPMTLSPRENVQFERLAQSKCFALIDDTASMQHSWPQTRAALAGIVDILSSNDRWDGLNVRFLHHAQTHSCVKTREDFESIFNSVTMWRGQRVMAAKVTQMFEESLRWMHGTSAPRPVALLIISDGLAIDTQELFNAMACICQKLNEKCISPHMFRIHMLQMGADRKAVQPLHDFRDRITQRDLGVDSVYSTSSVSTEEEGLSTPRISSDSFSPRQMSRLKRILILVRGYLHR